MPARQNISAKLKTPRPMARFRRGPQEINYSVGRIEEREEIAASDGERSMRSNGAPLAQPGAMLTKHSLQCVAFRPLFSSK